MGIFLTPLRVEEINDSVSQSPKWRLIDPLIYKSARCGFIIVDSGFVTNFASVPRLPFAYMFFGGRANKQAALHDYLYTFPHCTGCGKTLTRAQADRLFRGAMTDDLKYNTDFFDNFFIRYIFAHLISWSMWVGVRLGGHKQWQKE